MKKKVLFVCLGNICRSPAAEGVFLKLVQEADLAEEIHVDSAGTGGWHVGEPPDTRMVDHARRRGYDLSSLEARQFHVDDLKKFDYILTMDNSNLRNVLNLDVKRQYLEKVKPLVSFCRIHSVEEVPDPYYDGAQGFEHVLDLIEDACTELLQHLRGGLK